MIVTLTANPGLDRTATLGEPLARGGVNRVLGWTIDPGGKGINVARVVHAAGHPVRAILPAGPRDPILAELDRLALPHRSVPLAEAVRVNLTLTEADGTTTKVNEPGPSLTAETIEQLAGLLVIESEHADWVVLSGSLPPGVPTDWYASLVRALRPWGGKIAVDTSDAPLLALAAQFPQAAPDLLKPNSEELAQLTGVDADQLEAEATAGNPAGCVAAARAPCWSPLRAPGTPARPRSRCAAPSGRGTRPSPATSSARPGAPRPRNACAPPWPTARPPPPWRAPRCPVRTSSIARRSWCARSAEPGSGHPVHADRIGP
jgi:1-phosphofructokinase family hexose kinase